MNPSKIGLVLSGGGSRGAYQAGCLKALAEISVALKLPHPFPVITGVSAGAINSSFWAAYCDDYLAGARRLCALWENVNFEQVFTTDVLSLSYIATKWIRDISFAPMTGAHSAESLLNTKPLRHLIETHIDFTRIQKNIEKGFLSSLSITATDYGSTNSISFVQANDPVQMWERRQRKSVRTQIRADHVMASSALPLFFPPSKVDNQFYGDGCLRNTAPLSPAIHLGADKLLIIGVRKQPPESEMVRPLSTKPSIARVLSVVLNSILLDGIDWDIERLSRINRTLENISTDRRSRMDLKPVDFLWLHPSEDLGRLAQIETRQLPRTIRFLIKGLGPLQEASGIASYLLFDPGFCGQLVEMGYNDTMNRRSEVERFLTGEPS